MGASSGQESSVSSKLERALDFLLIDDDDISLFINRRVVELTPYCNSTLSVKKAENALELLRGASGEHSSWPDVILLDLEMPGMNGIAFLEAFGQLPGVKDRSVAILLVTSSDCKKAKEYALSLGVMQCLAKPLTEEVLTPIINTIFLRRPFIQKQRAI